MGLSSYHNNKALDQCNVNIRSVAEVCGSDNGDTLLSIATYDTYPREYGTNKRCSLFEATYLYQVQ
jgi:hypothetical protein